MALLSNIAGTEQVSLTKINATIDTVNLTGGGTLGQRLAKSSNSDFAFEYVNPELRTFTTTTINLDTATIGAGYNLYCDNQYDYRGNQRIKVYSLTSPSKYIIGLIDGASNTNAHYILESKNGSGSFSDGVVILYFESISYHNTGLLYSVSSNDIVSSLSTAGTNGTFTNYSFHGIKKGNIAHLSGQLVVTTTGTYAGGLTFILQDKYEWLNGNSQTFHKPVTGYYYATGGYSSRVPITGYITNEVNDPVSTFLAFYTNVEIPTSKIVVLHFDITYQTADYAQ